MKEIILTSFAMILFACSGTAQKAELQTTPKGDVTQTEQMPTKKAKTPSKSIVKVKTTIKRQAMPIAVEKHRSNSRRIERNEKIHAIPKN